MLKLVLWAGPLLLKLFPDWHPEFLRPEPENEKARIAALRVFFVFYLIVGIVGAIRYDSTVNAYEESGINIIMSWLFWPVELGFGPTLLFLLLVGVPVYFLGFKPRLRLERVRSERDRLTEENGQLRAEVSRLSAELTAAQRREQILLFQQSGGGEPGLPVARPEQEQEQEQPMHGNDEDEAIEELYGS